MGSCREERGSYREERGRSSVMRLKVGEKRVKAVVACESISLLQRRRVLIIRKEEIVILLKCGIVLN